jgi:tetratricopeptide (TPR) repeat protein
MRSRTWSWDPASQVFLPAEDEIHASNFRIHILHDADQAFLDGEYERALDLYARVREDDDLQAWVDPSLEQAHLEAYAAFRIVHTHYALGKSEAAEQAFNSLLDSFPEGTPGYAFVQMALAFHEEVDQSGNLNMACLSAQAFAE